MRQQQLETAYESNTFGVTRRTFLKAAAVAGVAALGGMLVFPPAATRIATGQSLPAATLDASGDVIRFTVHSDTHLGDDERLNGTDKVRAAFSALYSIVPNVAAHIFVGDSVDHGYSEEYDTLASLLNEVAQSPVALVMGNHEHHSGDDAYNEFETFLRSKLAVAGSPQINGGTYEGRPFFDLELGGCHLIAVSPEAGGYDNNLYENAGNWIRERVANAATEDANAPIFLFTHHPFPDSVWFSTSETQNGLFDNLYRELSESYPQVIHFSGHTHIPLADPRSIFQDGFTCVQTATFANCFWMKGGEDEGYDGGSYNSDNQLDGHPEAGDDASQCLLVEVEKATGIVTIRRIDFREGTFIGEPWVVETWAGATDFRYRPADREVSSLPPIIDADASVAVPDDSPESDAVSFSLTADKVHPNTSGLADDIVLAYRIEIQDVSTGDLVYDARFMSDYYRAQADQAVVFTRELIGVELEANTPYLLNAYAQNAYNKESFIGHTTFRTETNTL